MQRLKAAVLFSLCSALPVAMLFADERTKTAAALEDGIVRPEHDELELCEAVERRRLYYYQRHSDGGVLDSRRRRELVRREYEKERQRQRRLAADGIGGSVWVNVGPSNVGGRTRSIAPHPTVAGTVYVAAASGGIWKTTDSGATWTPLTEALASLTFGAVAVAPSNANKIYIGTGEAVGSASGIPGIGLLRSDDGGVNWSFPSPGFAAIPSSFWKLNVHPTNASDVLAGTSSGGFRSNDGGANWTPWVIPSGLPPGANDIVRDPSNASIVYAAFYQGGSSSKIVRSADGGSNWTDFSTGLPTTSVSRIALAISSDGATLYAGFYRSGVAYVYKSVSGGAWTVTSGSVHTNIYVSQPAYNNAIAVAPADVNTVIVCGVVCSKTVNGGGSWAALTAAGGSYHVDVHDLRYDAGGRLYMATDGGITTSTDHGENTTNREAGLVTSQFYDIAIDPVNSNRVFGGMQDNGTSRRNGAVTTWDVVASSDGGTAAVHHANPSIAWVSNQPISRGEFLFRINDAGAATPLQRQLTPLFPSAETLNFVTRYREDPVHSSTLYLATHRLWKSTTGGDAWFPLPTTVTGSGTWSATHVIDSIAVAPSNPSIIMVSKNTVIWKSEDGGSTWQTRTTGLPSPSRYVNDLVIDPEDANTAFAALATTAGNSVYKTVNGGLTWTQSSAGLPSFAAQSVRVDPTDSTTVYCGTDVGLYRSTDGGQNWSVFGTGLPSVPVYDIEIADGGTLLRAGTHGRGAWELQIPASGNTPPTAAISSPATSTTTVAKGTTVSFSGTISDTSGIATGSWHFSDTWETKPISSAGATSVSHTFTRSGVFPVTLHAEDAQGGVAAATVMVTVSGSGDACSAPIVIPNGALPATAFVDSEVFADSIDATDPTSSCGGFRYGTAWFQFTAPTAGTYAFDTCGSMIETVLSAWSGACGSMTGTQLACNDDADSTGTTCANGGSSLQVALSSGQTIRLMAHGRWYFYDRRGTIVLTAKLDGSSAPAVARIAPPAGPSAGSQSITIYGSNFGSSGTSVSIGGAAATNVVVHTPTVLTATTGPRAAGAVDVVVTNSDAQSGRLLSGYTYLTCGYTISPTSTSGTPAAFSGSFFVTAGAGCGWTAVSSAPWVTTTSAGIGEGTVEFSVAANTSVAPRSATISAGGQTFTINQSGVTVTNLVASATAATSISVSWDSAPVASFQVWRNSGSGFTQIATPSSSPYTDNSVSPDTAHVYRVRPVDSTAAEGAFSNDDLATTTLFTDAPFLSGSTLIRLIHVEELATAVNAVRATAGLGPFSFTTAPAAGGPVLRSQVIDLRAALDLARDALALPALGYTAISTGDPVTKEPYVELQNGVK